MRFRRTGALSPRGVRRAAPQRQRRPHPRDSRSRPASLPCAARSAGPRGRPSRSASFREESLFTQTRAYSASAAKGASTGSAIPGQQGVQSRAAKTRRAPSPSGSGGSGPRSASGFRLPVASAKVAGFLPPSAGRRPPLASRRAFYLFFYFAMLYLDLCFILRYLFISSCL